MDVSEFDYNSADVVPALRQYLKDVPNLGYNGQYLMREAAATIERLRADLARVSETTDGESV
jgi:hypothetical protein